MAHDDRFLNRQINFANHSYLLSIIIIFGYIVFYSIYDFNLFLPIIIFDSFVIITIIFALFLNINGQFRASKIFFMIIAHIFLSFLSIHYGYASGFHFFFFLFLAFAILTFDFDNKTEKFLALTFIIMSFTGFLFAEIFLINVKPLIELSDELLRYLYILSLTGAFSFLVIILSAVMLNIKKRL